MKTELSWKLSLCLLVLTHCWKVACRLSKEKASVVFLCSGF